MEGKPKIPFNYLSGQWIQQKHAGFLFESLLEKKKKPYTFYIHFSEHLMVPANNVI